MRNFLFLVSFSLLAACSSTSTETAETLPQDYDSLRTLFTEKQESLAELQHELDEIEAAMHKLNNDRERLQKLVSTKLVEKQEFKRYIRVQGSVEPEDVANISTEIGGRITSLLVDEGDAVRRGQLVARIDMETIAKQKAELETQLQLARTVYERQSRLWEQNIGSEIQYLEAKTNVERLEKSVAALHAQLTKANLYAPITGVVDNVYLKSGEAAVPGAPIADILSTTRLKVEADAPESLLGKIRTGDNVSLTFPSIGEEMEAKVSSLGRRIDPANRTIKVEVGIPGHNIDLKPNLLAEVLVNDLTLADTIVISQELVQQEVSGRKYVLIVDMDSENKPVAKKVSVETGPSYDGNVVITRGLSGGETLITTGARGLSHGEPLEISESTEKAGNGEG